jgi:preprotein translocase subunit SecB
MNTPEIQAKIRLDLVQFVSVSFETNSVDKDVTKEVSLSMELSIERNTGNNTSFRVVFDISLHSPQNELRLNLKAIALFVTTETISDEFLHSPLAKVNAPAIAFPFIRAYIANFTLNCGFNPIMLPSFNFQAMNRLSDLPYAVNI